jgi:hypothetical protein
MSSPNTPEHAAPRTPVRWVAAALLVTGLLPMLMGGDPASLKIAESLGAFVRDPKSLSVSLKAKGAPVRFLDAPTLADPSAFLAKVDVAVTANK